MKNILFIKYVYMYVCLGKYMVFKYFDLLKKKGYCKYYLNKIYKYLFW